MENPTELKDVQKKDIRDPLKSIELYNQIQKTLDEYVDYTKTGDMAFMIEDKAIKKMFLEKVVPFNKKIEPLADEHIKLADELAEIDAKRKVLLEKMDSIRSEIDALGAKRNKFITRISPMVIRKYQPLINKFQQFTSIIEQDGEVFVVVKDWLGSFISGYLNKQEVHNEKVTKKITNNKIVAND